MKIVSDSTPLIHSAKISRISLLKNLFNEIIILKEIYKEIVEGKKHGKNEILIIEKFIEEKFILIKEPKSVVEIENLDRGEKECISLCKELNISNILIDEKEGFYISQLFDSTPIRTTSILIISLDKKIINLKEYRVLLKKLVDGGYFLDALTYERLLNIGRGIVKSRT